MLPILLPLSSEADAGVMAVKIKQFFSLLQIAIGKNGISQESVPKAELFYWSSPCRTIAHIDIY